MFLNQPLTKCLRVAVLAGIVTMGFLPVCGAREPSDEQIDDTSRVEATLAREQSFVMSAIANGILDPKDLAKLTRQDLFLLFRFDLRQEFERLQEDMIDAMLRDDFGTLERLERGTFLDLVLDLNGHQTSLLGSNSSEMIYSKGDTSVWKVHNDEFEIFDDKQGKSYTLVFGDTAAQFYIYDRTGKWIDGGIMPYDGHGGPSGAVKAFLLALGIDVDSDTQQEMEKAAEEGGDLGGPNDAPPKTAGGDDAPSETGEESSLVGDFIDEAEKAWDLFADMIDDAIDYGPDYVDPDSPIIRYTAGLQELCDLYLQIKLDAIINADRTDNPMGPVVSDDEWLSAMLAIAFYRPPPSSDPVDRPLREVYDVTGIDLTFDGAIDYGEDHWEMPKNPDDIPIGPKGN